MLVMLGVMFSLSTRLVRGVLIALDGDAVAGIGDSWPLVFFRTRLGTAKGGGIDVFCPCDPPGVLAGSRGGRNGEDEAAARREVARGAGGGPERRETEAGETKGDRGEEVGVRSKAGVDRACPLNSSEIPSRP